MTLPVTFANLPTGNNPASTLDQNFAAVGAMGTTYCTATGTNALLLSVGPNQPNPTSYVNGQRFNFIAPANSTGAVTIQVGGLAALPLRSAGLPLIGGSLVAGTICEAVISGNGLTADLVGGGGYMPLSGGTIIGSLTINAPGPATAQLTLNKGPGGGFNNLIVGQTTALARWAIALGDTTAESGSNVGSDFDVYRYDDTGTLIDTPIFIKRSTGAVIINGTSTNDNAAGGKVGEYFSSIVGSPGTTLATGTGATVTSIALSGGDWDVSGEVWFGVGTGGATTLAAGISSSSATVPSGPGTASSRNSMYASIAASGLPVLSLAPARVSAAGPTTMYLVALAVFPSGTTTAYGRIGARRMR